MKEIMLTLVLALGGCASTHTEPVECIEHEPAPGRAISLDEACSALGNAWEAHVEACGPFVCPYGAAVDIDENTRCILGLLERGDTGANCGELAAWVDGCVCAE